MGFLDIVLEGRPRRSARGKRTPARAINKYAQSPDRMKALQALRDDGSDEALFGLMRRFGMMYDKTIEDEQEKEWVFELLVEKGAAVLPPLKKYLLRGRLDLLAAAPAGQGGRHQGRGRSTSSPRCWSATSPATSAIPPRRSSCSTTWRGLKHPRVSRAGRALPRRHGRGRALRRRRGAAAAGRRGRGARAAARRTSSRKEESLRLRIRIADGFAELGWPVGDKRAEVEKVLPETLTRSKRAARSRRASRRNPERRNRPTAVPKRDRHQDRHADRVRPDRDRAGLRVRLLRDPGRQGAQGRGLPGRAGELEPGDDHDRSGDRRPHLRRAADGRRADQRHRARAPRRAPADAGRADGAEPGAGPAQGRRARRLRRQADRRAGRGHREGRGPPAVQGGDGEDRPRRAAVGLRAQPGRGARHPGADGGGDRRRLPGAAAAVVHAGRLGRGHRLERRGVRRQGRLGPAAEPARRGAGRAVGARLEGIRAGGDARHARTTPSSSARSRTSIRWACTPATRSPSRRR